MKELNQQRKFNKNPQYYSELRLRSYFLGNYKLCKKRYLVSKNLEWSKNLELCNADSTKKAEISSSFGVLTIENDNSKDLWQSYLKSCFFSKLLGLLFRILIYEFPFNELAARPERPCTLFLATIKERPSICLKNHRYTGIALI